VSSIFCYFSWCNYRFCQQIHIYAVNIAKIDFRKIVKTITSQGVEEFENGEEAAKYWYQCDTTGDWTSENSSWNNYPHTYVEREYIYITKKIFFPDMNYSPRPDSYRDQSGLMILCSGEEN
jgi:hypothetical protein